MPGLSFSFWLRLQWNWWGKPRLKELLLWLLTNLSIPKSTSYQDAVDLFTGLNLSKQDVIGNNIFQKAQLFLNQPALREWGLLWKTKCLTFLWIHVGSDASLPSVQSTTRRVLILLVWYAQMYLNVLINNTFVGYGVCLGMIYICRIWYGIHLGYGIHLFDRRYRIWGSTLCY